MNASLMTEQLETNGLCVWPNFLCPEALRDIQADFDDIQASGGFSRAAIGSGDHIHKIRRDSTHWLDRLNSNAAQNKIWDKLDSMEQSLNRSLFLGINRFDGHYASFPEGGFYGKHLDSNQKNNRIVSLALYLNHHWQEADGGQLRVYDKKSYTDINPIGGTMVCFLSRESEHEVLESRATRSSFTGWFKTA